MAKTDDGCINQRNVSWQIDFCCDGGGSTKLHNIVNRRAATKSCHSSRYGGAVNSVGDLPGNFESSSESTKQRKRP